MEEYQLFHWSKLKIEWANKRIKDLNGLLNAFIQSDFCRLAVEKDTGEHIVVFEMTSKIPAEISFLIGETLLGLRPPLDYLAREVVKLSGGISTKDTKFPFGKERKEVEAALHGGVMQGIGLEMIACIMEEVQPYKGGNDSLYALHLLSGTDKHDIPAPIICVAQLLHVDMTVGTNKFTDCTFSVMRGKKLGIINVPPGAQFHGHGQPAFGIEFGDVEGFQGQPVIPTLLQLSQLVSHTIQIVERAFLASRRRL